MIEPFVAAVGLMTFLATHLAKNAGLEVARAATTTGALLLAAPEATAASTSSAAVVGAPTAPLVGDVRGVLASSAHLNALLLGDELCVQLVDRDGLNTGGDGGDDPSKSSPKPVKM